MKFVQIMEVTTDKFDEFEALHERWLAATEGERTTELEWVLRDRDNPNRYVIVVQFDSFQEAMKNNDLPATAEIASKMNELADAPTVFRNLDLIRID
jgi:quinol monooxygenase YgiN